MKKGILNFFGGALMLSLVISSCKEDDVALPPIGGFNNAGEVGKNDLVGYFPLNGNGNESISGSTPESSVNTTFVTGKKGQCASFAKGYIAHKPIAALTASTASYSVSCWFALANNKNNPTMLVSLTRPNEWAGNFNMMSETGWKDADNDTLVLKGLLVSVEANGASFQDSRNEPSKGGVQAFKGASTPAKENWVHGVITYDATNSNFFVYANGVKISNPEWEVRTGTGDLVFNSGVSRVLLGAFGPNVPGNGTADTWQVPMTGKLDEVRIWKKALSGQEVDALYQLELAGR
jgi:hypothetical protein